MAASADYSVDVEGVHSGSSIRLKVETVTLFGVPLCNTGFDGAVQIVLDCVRRGGSNSIFFFNAHAVNVAHGDAEYRKALRKATYVLPDGVGVRIAAVLAGRRLRPDLNPTDLYPRLCLALQGTGVRIFLLGCEPGVAEEARRRALSEYPGLSICGARHGFFSREEEPEVIADIRKARTDVLFVGMGIPRQEKWIMRNLEATGARVALGVGALFEYHAGKAQRAPLWMRRMGLEWLGRLIPGRGAPRRLWRRYLLGNFKFLSLALVHGMRVRLRTRGILV